METRYQLVQMEIPDQLLLGFYLRGGYGTVFLIKKLQQRTKLTVIFRSHGEQTQDSDLAVVP